MKRTILTLLLVALVCLSVSLAPHDMAVDNRGDLDERTCDPQWSDEKFERGATSKPSS